ncbi:ABC transporter substrate-binding protein [Actinomadura rupiterrae]|uniref:ABC transporter substrate-binding protein n=1 Tax=Actinomadura rupiterrae TaxID=559627 RepID=UPI0020A2DFE8|nr:ABC transporter substrate-binding protein [Actinomadura rupiterrae]MCP2338552.1 polar amino acid transport system substrate-binding protein [Actinomadura rupiterrae]
MSTRIPRLSALAAAAAALALTTLSACGGSDKGVTVQGAKLVTKGQLTTCTHLPYPPFQFEKGGKVVGFDVDLMDLVAKKLGVTQKVVDTPFETIKTGAALNAGKCDVAAAGMTIKPERAKFIDFTKPYFEATQAAMSKKGASFPAVADLKKAKVGTQASTTGEDFVHGAKIDSVSFDDSAALLNGLRTGKVDVIVEDYPVVQGWLKDPANAAYAVAGNYNTGEQYGFAVRKGKNNGLKDVIDSVIAQSRSDGSYKAIYEKWIGPMPEGH